MPEERKVYRRPARTAVPAPQAGQAAPRPDAPPPPKKKKRPGAKRRRSRLVLGLCLLCLLVVVIVSVVLVRCSAEEEGPAEADFGTPAAAWQKNDLGYYFNTSGRAMPAAVLKGMDVSKFQGEIDWEKAKAAAFTLLKEQLVEVLGTLTEREQKVLRLRFGLDDGRARTLEEVGKEFNVTRERIRQIEAKALRKLRHPSRSRKLKDYLD